MRIVLFLLGAAVVAGVFVQQPRDYAKVCLGVLGSLIPFMLAAVLDRACFDFDASERRVRWRRTNLLRSLSGELSFDEISDVLLHARLETRSDSARRRTYSVYRVVLATSAGDLPLSNSWVADERGQSQVVEAIRAALGKSPSRPVDRSDIENLVAAGHGIDAVQLARARLGLSLTEAQKYIDDKIGSETRTRAF